MNGDAAEEVVRMAVNGADVAIRLVGAGAKNLALLLLAWARNEKVHTGKTSLPKLLSSGDELHVLSLSKEEYAAFKKQARKKITYAPFLNTKNKDGKVDVVVGLKQEGIVNRILDRIGYEMMKPEYCEYYARLMGINVSGGANVNDILSMLPSGTGGDVCRAAISKLGAPYVLGAKGDDKFDCSGLVCWAINQVDPDLGVHFWARAADQAFYCHSHDMEIDRSELQPGDLVFWQNSSCSGCGRWNEVHHTGIYIGLGMVIEASSSKGRVVIRELWSSENYPIYMFARPYS